MSSRLRTISRRAIWFLFAFTILLDVPLFEYAYQGPARDVFYEGEPDDEPNGYIRLAIALGFLAFQGCLVSTALILRSPSKIETSILHLKSQPTP